MAAALPPSGLPISSSAAAAVTKTAEAEIKGKAEDSTSNDARIISLSQTLDSSKSYSDYELSFHFGVVAPGDGTDAKGVFSNEKRIDSDITELAQFMKGEYLVFARTKEGTTCTDECVIIKKGLKPGSLEYYDNTAKTFKTLDQAALTALKFKESDRCIQVGQGAENPKSFVFDTPSTTPHFPPISKKMFYQERQSGLLCAYHAMNAFHGQRTCSLFDYSLGNLQHYQKTVACSAEDLQSILSEDPFNPLESNDPGMLCEHIKSLSKAGALPADYQNLKVHNLNNIQDQSKIKDSAQWKAVAAEINHPSVDRVIVGWGAEHFLALRKTEEGKWRVIDSQNNDSQLKEYSSVEDCLSQYVRPGYKPTYFNLLFVPPPKKAPAGPEAINHLAQAAIAQAAAGAKPATPQK